MHERFEDGTLPFLNIIALGHALDTHRRLYKSQSHVSKHVTALRRFATHELSLLKHANGRPVFLQHHAFGASKFLEGPGPIIGFSLLGPSTDPEFIGHVHLDQLATINGFHIRTGGLCNTGVLASSLNLSDQDLVAEYARGRACWDDGTFLLNFFSTFSTFAEEFGGVEKSNQRPLGMARISFGASSTIDDILQWISFIRRYFVVSEKIFSLTGPSCSQPSSVYPTTSLRTLMLCAWAVQRVGLAV